MPLKDEIAKQSNKISDMKKKVEKQGNSLCASKHRSKEALTALRTDSRTLEIVRTPSGLNRVAVLDFECNVHVSHYGF